MRDEILRSKRLGLNANRIHIKVEVPRKLYWADRLGLVDHGRRAEFLGRTDARSAGTKASLHCAA